MPVTAQTCAWCGHGIHPRGQKCGVLNFDPKGKAKPCKCKAGGGWLDSVGNAIGESLFGGNR